eukprot:scaffold656_cov403-Pavlova_lutheri.AAC.14
MNFDFLVKAFLEVAFDAAAPHTCRPNRTCAIPLLLDSILPLLGSVLEKDTKLDDVFITNHAACSSCNIQTKVQERRQGWAKLSPRGSSIGDDRNKTKGITRKIENSKSWLETTRGPYTYSQNGESS